MFIQKLFAMKICLFITLTRLWDTVFSEQKTWILPLENSKVTYHHKKICLIINGVENCINKDQEPGNPEELAKMFSVVHQYETDQDDPSQTKLAKGRPDRLPPQISNLELFIDSKKHVKSPPQISNLELFIDSKKRVKSPPQISNLELFIDSKKHVKSPPMVTTLEELLLDPESYEKSPPAVTTLEEIYDDTYKHPKSPPQVTTLELLLDPESYEQSPPQVTTLELLVDPENYDDSYKDPPIATRPAPLYLEQRKPDSSNLNMVPYPLIIDPKVAEGIEDHTNNPEHRTEYAVALGPEPVDHVMQPDTHHVRSPKDQTDLGNIVRASLEPSGPKKAKSVNVLEKSDVIVLANSNKEATPGNLDVQNVTDRTF